MQHTIDSAQRSYLLRTNLQQMSKEGNPVIADNHPIVNREITMLDKSAAFLAGAAISMIVNNLKQTNSKFFLMSFEKISALPSLDETKYVADKMLERIHRKDPAVRALFVQDNTVDTEKAAQIIAKNTLVGFRRTFNISEKNLISKAIKLFADRNASWIAKGQKASYFVNEKIAIASQNKHQQIFHELGHASVANNKVLKPLLTVGKKLPMISFVAGFFALEHTPRPYDSKHPKTRWEKTQDYMDAHIGKITFLTFIPLLIEKFIASEKSLKQVQKHLSRPKINSLKKLYRVGLLTYLATGLAAAAGIGLGNKVQNNIIKQKQSPQDVYNLLI